MKEIKLASELKDKHKLQAAAYTMMIGNMQRYTPEFFFLIDGKGETSRYEYADHEDGMREALALALKIRGGWIPLPIHGSGNYPWHNYTKEAARRDNNTSLIPGVGKVIHGKMLGADLTTVDGVAASSVPALEQIRGIGEAKGVSFLMSARAIIAGECIRKDYEIDLPDRSTEIFLDLEGSNKYVDADLGDYMIGILVRKGGCERYHSFIAEDRREDCMLEEFVGFMDGQDDYAIYHWGDYERQHLEKMMKQHGVDAYHLLEQGTRFDLHKIAPKAFAFPTYSHSIKDVARHFGFNWRHEGVNATSSMDLYEQYVEDPEANADKLQLVKDYNEDDCVATMRIKDWLAEQK